MPGPVGVFEHVGKKTFPASVFLANKYGRIVICGATTGYDLNFGSGAADLGKPVFAVADGVVVDSFLAGWGNLIRVEHRLADGLEFWSLYGHLDERYVRVGETVSRGQTIATVGSTGTVSPHLHFELRKAPFPAAEFPCSRTEWQVRANYYDPGEFIRDHCRSACADGTQWSPLLLLLASGGVDLCSIRWKRNSRRDVSPCSSGRYASIEANAQRKRCREAACPT